jgi:DNA-binding MarR family transcriptional regulator
MTLASSTRRLRARLHPFRVGFAGIAGGIGAILGALYEDINPQLRIASIAAIGLLTVLAVFLTEPPSPIRTASPGTPSLESRIKEAARSLQVTAGLMSELQAEMEARTASLERIRTENDEFERLASVTRKEAEAVTRVVESAISAAHVSLGRSSRRDQLVAIHPA